MTIDQLHDVANAAIDSPERERLLVAALVYAADAPMTHDYRRGSVAHLLKFCPRKDFQ